MRIYDVFYDGDPETMSDVAFQVMLTWISFAMGFQPLHGRQLKHPTGRYASSIRVEGRSPSHIAIVSDEELAPESRWIEEGHGPIDLKNLLVPGRTYPMHRGTPGHFGSAGYGPAIAASSFSARTANVWAVPRAAGYSGVARVPSTITPENATSWIIPAMPSYSPAAYLAEAVRRGEFG